MNRKTVIAGSIVLGIVAFMLAVTAYFTGERKVLIVAVVLLAIALVLSTQGRKGNA